MALSDEPGRPRRRLVVAGVLAFVAVVVVQARRIDPLPPAPARFP